MKSIIARGVRRLIELYEHETDGIKNGYDEDGYFTEIRLKDSTIIHAYSDIGVFDTLYYEFHYPRELNEKERYGYLAVSDTKEFLRLPMNAIGWLAHSVGKENYDLGLKLDKRVPVITLEELELVADIMSNSTSPRLYYAIASFLSMNVTKQRMTTK